MNEVKSDTQSYATDLDTLSRGDASSTNMLYLEDLCWEHFAFDTDGNIVSDRLPNPILNSALERFGSFTNNSFLELGAYEGYYSLALSQLGASEIYAIEGNPRNFLKCCAIKNHFNLNKAMFSLGDCAKYLESCERKYDVVLATGILYHLFNPIAALNNICRITDKIIIDTTYYHSDPKLQGFNFTGNIKKIELPGLEGHVLHERLNTTITMGKKHGMYDRAWMFSLDTLEQYLTIQGFEYEVVAKTEEPDPYKVRAVLIASRK